MRRGLAGLAGLALLGGLSCWPTQSQSMGVQVGYVDGCRALFEDRTCVVNRAKGRPPAIKLWIDGVGPQQEVSVSLDGGSIARQVGSGLMHVRLERTKGAMSVWVEGHEQLRLTLMDEPTAYTKAMARVRPLYDRGDYRGMQVALERERVNAPHVAAQMLECYIAQVAFNTGDRARFEHARLGDLDLLCAASLAHIAVRTALERGDFAAVRAHLRAAKAEPWLVSAQVEAAYYEWDLERRIGRVDAAIRGFEQVAARARELGVNDTAGGAEIMAATAMSALGRFDAALGMTERALAIEGLDDQFRLQLRQNAAWVRFEARTRRPELPDPKPEFRALLAEFEQRGTNQDLDRAASTRLNLVIALVHDGEYAVAATELERLDRARLETFELVHVELLSSELAAERGDFVGARAHVERAELLASLAHKFDTRLLAQVGRASLERRAGNLEAARTAYARVGELADQIVLEISPHAGRSLFGSRLREAQAEQLELLLELGDAPAALCAVLGARARYQRSLAAGVERSDVDRARLEQVMANYQRVRADIERKLEDAWDLPTPQLEALQRELSELQGRLDAATEDATRELGAGSVAWACEAVWHSKDSTQALLTMHPGRERGWWFALARGESVTWVESELDDARIATEQALGRLLEGVSAADGIELLRVVPVAEMIAVDVHQHERVRELGIPVVYSLGLGSARVEAEPRQTAAVVAGRSGLVHVERELAEVSARLQAGGWAVASAWSPEAERQPGLLHFAGHGRHAGVAGWDSQIVLADRELSSRELLALQRAPRQVVLTACSTGAGDVQAIDGGMNMATAFLLAGAELVIAPNVDIDDSLGPVLAETLYREGDAGALARALAKAQREDARLAAWRTWER